MNSAGAYVGVVVLTIIFVILLGFILAYPVMLLWNGCLVPAAPFLENIGWLQAWGLTVLFGFLFKSSSSSKTKS